jgi:hypothetical protein
MVKRKIQNDFVTVGKTSGRRLGYIDLAYILKQKITKNSNQYGFEKIKKPEENSQINFFSLKNQDNNVGGEN